MSSNQSFQLPDLLGIIGPLELRTNRHCRFATGASEKWFSETGTVTTIELSYLRSTKIGLLCSLCFPTCDSPQLRILIDFSTMLLYSGLREKTGNDTLDLSGVVHVDPFRSSSNLAAGSLREKPHENGVDLLKGHGLLRHIIDQRLINLASAASEDWNARFRKSVLGFQAAQHRAQNTIPSLENYIAITREVYGSSMVLDLAELFEVFQFPDLHGTDAEKILNLKYAACDVIAWSLDVVSYQLQRDHGSSHNLVAVLMHHNNLSVQGAMNHSGNMIKQAFASFSSAERSILDSLDKQRAPKPPLLSWMWTGLASESVPAEAEIISNNVRQYIRVLKDCIVGVVHWVYETELFFGKKGGEIRTFGWVFVDQVTN